MNTYLVDFLGWDYSYGDKDLIQFQVKAWSEEEARKKVLSDRSHRVMSEIGVELISEYSEQDHDELELRMEQGV
jgi:hypothetical protein